jgi:hypothetical protein
MSIENSLKSLSLDENSGDWMRVNVDSKEDVLNYARLVWKWNKTHNLVNSPLYQSPTIDEIVCLVIKSWIILEKCLLDSSMNRKLSERRLEPFRDIEEIKLMLIDQGVQQHPDDYIRMLRETGGIGRYMDSWLNQSYSPSMLPNILDYYVQNTYFRAVIHRLFVNSNLGKSPSTIYGISVADVGQIGVSLSEMRKMEDQSLLFYSSTRHHYELMFPCHMDTMRQYFDASYRIRLQYVALATTLRGWDGYGSAGQVLEPFIIRKMMSETCPPFHGDNLNYDEENLSFREKNEHDDEKHVFIGSLNVDNIIDRVFRLKKDCGIDTIHFRKGIEENVVEAIVTQIKTGKMSKSIKLGTKSSKDGDSFKSILLKAERAWIQLKEEFKKLSTFGGIEFCLSLFALITNKKLDDAIKDLDETEMEVTRVSLELFSKSLFDETFATELEFCNLLGRYERNDDS